MTTLVMKLAPGNDCFRWRLLNGQGMWSGAIGLSSLPALAAQWPGARVILLIDGKEAVVRQMSYAVKEKKHLARLLPYQLESDTVSDIDSLHVAVGMPGEQTVPVVYLKRTPLQKQIDVLEAAGFRVQRCYAEPQLLQRAPGQWVLSLEQWPGGEQIAVATDTLATCCDKQMIAVLLAALVSDQAIERPHEIVLRACDAAGISLLESALPQTLSEAVKITKQLQEDAWDTLAVDQTGQAVNLRQGALAAPLRLAQYWPSIKVPVVATLVALLVFIVSGIIEVQRNNAEFRNIQISIEQAYRRAVPQGALVDAEQQLRSQLARIRGEGTYSGLMPLLDQIAPYLLADNSTVQVHRMGFSAETNELQLAITADSNTDILTFSESLNNAGLSAQARNLSRSGNRQQANLVIGGMQ
jgi:general secretion pathway protein L